MISHVQKWLFLVLVFAAGIATTTQDVLAGTLLSKPDQGVCAAFCASIKAYTPATAPYSDECDHTPLSGMPLQGTYICHTYLNGNFSGGCNNQYGQQGCYYTEACPDETTTNTGSVSGVYPAPLSIPSSVCKDGCSFDPVIGSTSEDCQYIDSNANGFIDDGETYSCNREYQGGSSACVEGDPDYSAPLPPSVPEFDCTNVDCSDNEDTSPPSDGGGAGSGDPNDSGGSAGGADGGTDGGNAGGGDGDPDTPGTGDGTGSGDTDGDGDRDVDCNPLSNPDCAFAGSGNASAICGAPPSCSGDPVQCAILMQNYNVMCAILTTAENEKKDEEAQSAKASNDCDVPPQCDGDPVQCTLIRQMWENQCNLIDTGSETPLSDDPDYGRDLAGEGEGTEVDISSGLDETGLGTGTCPAPIAINTTWANFTIDTAPLCSIAGWVRVFVILFTLLWAGPYVVRSF